MANLTVADPDGPIVILGASYARGWNPEPVGGRHFVNRGIGGQQSWELVARFDADVVAAKPRAVIIWGFINDVFRSPRADVDNAVRRAGASIEELVDRTIRSGAEPVLATEVTIRGKGKWPLQVVGRLMALLGRPGYQDYINGHVLGMNEQVRRLAQEKNLLLLDFCAELGGLGGLRQRRYAARDGSHISTEGYQRLNAYARPLLEARFGSRPR